MKKVVIVGSSVAGHSLAFALRSRNTQCAITVVTGEEYHGYDRRGLLGYFAGTVKEKDLFLCSAEAYARENITLRKETEAAAVNCDRGTVSLKKEDGRESIPFDFLVVCSGTAIVPPEVPGIHKEGVFAFNGLADVKAAKAAVINGPVCLIGGWNATAAALAGCLLSMKKEVLVVAPAPSDGPVPGVTFVDSAVTEFIGESGLQAVKFREGKIIGSSFCLLTGPRVPSLDFIKGTDIALDDKGFIATDDGLRTSRPGIFACGSVTGKCDSWEEALAQASTLSETLAGLI